MLRRWSSTVIVTASKAAAGAGVGASVGAITCISRTKRWSGMAAPGCACCQHTFATSSKSPPSTLNDAALRGGKVEVEPPAANGQGGLAEASQSTNSSGSLGVDRGTGSTRGGDSQSGGGGGDGSGGAGDNSGGPSRRESKGPITWASLLLTGVVGFALTKYYQIEKDKAMSKQLSQVKSTGKPALGGPWTLVDMHGQPKTDKDYLGQWVLLYFGFTFCPDICPSELVKVGNVVDQLDKVFGKGVVKPVFISVDPERDSLEQLRHYAQDFHPSIDYLTGTKEQVAKAAKAYRVYYSTTEDHEEGEDYLVDHSIVIYLLNKEGEFVDFFVQRMSVSDCVEKMTKLIKEQGA